MAIASPPLADPLAILGVVGAVWGAAVVTPGPNFLATAHRAASVSRRAGLGVVLGLLTGTGIWATASLAGLAVVLARFAWLHEALRLAGALYLIFLGTHMVAGAVRCLPNRASAGELGLENVPGGASGAWQGPWRLGLLTNLSNPKTAVFFTSLFVVAVPAEAPTWLAPALVTEVLVISALWYGAVAWAFSGGRAAAAYGRARRWLEATGGVLFAGFGVALALDG